MSDPLEALRELFEGWRADAERFREYGAERLARACEKHADELEARVTEWGLQLLTLEEAAEETGLAYDTVGRKVRDGEIPNAGEKGAPRIRRADLYPWLDAPEPRLETDAVDALAARIMGGR